MADSIRGNIYCLARELHVAFLVIRYSVSPDHASQAVVSMVSTWIGARYTLQNGGCVVTLTFGWKEAFFGSRFVRSGTQEAIRPGTTEDVARKEERLVCELGCVRERQSCR